MLGTRVEWLLPPSLLPAALPPLPSITKHGAGVWVSTEGGGEEGGGGREDGEVSGGRVGEVGCGLVEVSPWQLSGGRKQQQRRQLAQIERELYLLLPHLWSSRGS